jgi:hypothetical protein
LISADVDICRARVPVIARSGSDVAISGIVTPVKGFVEKAFSVVSGLDAV